MTLSFLAVSWGLGQPSLGPISFNSECLDDDSIFCMCLNVKNTGRPCFKIREQSVDLYYDCFLWPRFCYILIQISFPEKNRSLKRLENLYQVQSGIQNTLVVSEIGNQGQIKEHSLNPQNMPESWLLQSRGSHWKWADGDSPNLDHWWCHGGAMMMLISSRHHLVRCCLPPDYQNQAQSLFR